MSEWKPPSTQGRPVVILGGGVLGRRISALWLAGGFDVHIRDPSAEQRIAATSYIENSVAAYAKYVDGTKPGKFEAFTDLELAIKNAWLIIESVPERLDIKVPTFAELDAKAPADCIMCTNSSSFKSSDLIEKVRTENRNRILNMHYMMPPDNRVVELMTDGETSPEIFPFLVERLRGIGMHPIVARKESTGFVFNRLWAAIKREVLTILAEGVSVPEELDAVWMEMYGSKQGPCAMMDSVGLDTVALIEQHYMTERHLSGAYTVDYLRANYLDQGKLGAKCNKGGLYPPGYTVKTAGEASDDHHNIHAPTLYFLDIGLSTLTDTMHAGRILVGAPDGRPTRTIVSGQTLPDGLDVDMAAGRLYWTNMGIPSKNDGSVLSCALDGSDITTVIPSGHIHTPKQLVLDHANAQLYVSDREGLRVMRCNLDGSALETLVQTGDWRDEKVAADQTNWPVGITVDPGKKVFYWTQKGPSKAFHGRIFRANMAFPTGQDATTRTDIETLFSGLPEPIDLELEPEAQVLYWTDRGELPLGNSLNRVAVAEIGKKSGGLGYEILARNLHEAIGLKLDTKNRHVYLTDLGGSVYRFGMDGEGRKVLYSGEGAFSGISLGYV
ncbi:hypothetical protein MMC11_003224 [Xylographa trunciseda]|nr:hypothetical protein [Xylographa trunciseda]